MLDDTLRLIGILLFVAALVAIVTRRLRLPYSVGLVAAGLLLAVLPLPLTLPLSRDLIFTVLLPPIVFEAALNIHWRDLERNGLVLVVFASVGVAIATMIVALGMHVLAGWSWPAAALFGALIAATDPVSVIATFKNVKIDPRLHLLVESESLMNDGTAAVAFAVILAIVAGEHSGPVEVGSALARMILGGCACGAAVALGLLFVAGRTSDHLVELTLTTLIAYGSFLLADRLELSGVLAAMTAGLIVGNAQSLGSLSDLSREAMCAYWDYVAFLANSVIFLLIGAHMAEQPIAEVWRPTLVAIVIVLAGRALAVYPIAALFTRSRHRIDFRHQHVLVWGGLRGALALGLAFSLPLDLPLRGQVVTVTFAVVAFSIVVQGLTMTPLLRRLALIRTTARS